MIKDMKNISISDVAKRANVSIATVSNVINGTRPVSDKLRKDVMQAMKELGYEPNLSKRTPRKRQTKTIGVIVTSLRRVFFLEVLNGIQHNAEKYGYNIFIDTSEDNIEKESEIIKAFVNNRVDGIIIHPLCDNNDKEYLSFLSNLKRYNMRIPVVSMERDLTRYNIDSVYIDNYHGARLAVKHLIDLNCKKIACLRGPINSEVSNDRFNAYCDILNEHNLDINENFIFKGDFSPLSGYRLTRRLLLNGIKPDAIFASNDQMATGAIYAVKEYGLNIPENVKIVGFDNTFVSSIINPQLTTVNVPKFRMGEEAFSLLYKRISENKKNSNAQTNDNNKSIGIKLPIDLIIRQSTDQNAQSSSWNLEDW